ncbi:DUF3644 domain-containing protein [Alienimonas californiensis]|nr:DUF3644 domain-containing protein [Alienimonas californiensis]
MEIYNKPDFKYREETFSILCVNAWELLLKSKLLNLSGNKVAALYVMDYKTLKSGKRSKIKHKKINRAGNPMTIGIEECWRGIQEDFGVKVDQAIIDNLTALTEVRDNAIHFVNDDISLCLVVQELGTAALQNYLHLATSWFGNILDGYNFYLMPLSFVREFDTSRGALLNPQEKKMLSYISSVEARHGTGKSSEDYNFLLRIDLKFHKGSTVDAVPVKYSKDADATEVRFSEEDITDRFPWDYSILTTRLGKRYEDFKVNKDYHKFRKQIERDKKLAHTRLLNPNNPNGGRKILYNPNIVRKFDAHYKRSSPDGNSGSNADT